MGLAKLVEKVGTVVEKMNVAAAGEMAGEALLMYSRMVAVLHPHPTSHLEAGRGSGATVPGVGGSLLTAEEELIVIGLAVDFSDHRS